MRIGIDISQVAFEHTGVARYVQRLVTTLIAKSPSDEFVLFGASLRKHHILQQFVSTMNHSYPNVRPCIIRVPPLLLDMLWNRLHIVPVEWIIGPIDIFWSSDWTQPPLQNAKGVTTIHDLVVLKYPEESNPVAHIDIKQGQFRANIVDVHKRRLHWIKKECAQIFCDSIATKKDIMNSLSISSERVQVVYPGYP